MASVRGVIRLQCVNRLEETRMLSYSGMDDIKGNDEKD